MAAKIISFLRGEACRDESKLEKAYEWAIAVQKYYGFVAQRIALNGEALSFLEQEHGSKNSFISIFCSSKEPNRVILRRDWDEGYVVQYNVLDNYEELKNQFPDTIGNWEKNGIKLYKRYLRAGFNFGV